VLKCAQLEMKLHHAGENMQKSDLRQRASVLALVVSLAAGDLKSVELEFRTPTADQVVNRMLEMNQARESALRQYTSQRRYVAENPRFSKSAEVTVQESYGREAGKQLTIVSENGSPFVQHRVIDKLIQAEIESGRDDRDQTMVTTQNYSFRLVGTENIDGHQCYVLEVTPKAPKKYLMRGRIWVDDAEYAIVKMEGTPAKNPSFWTRRVRFVRRYEKHGPFWLPASVESESDVLAAGQSTLKIEYFEYHISASAPLPADAPDPLIAQQIAER
jgi:hypothetical protein